MSASDNLKSILEKQKNIIAELEQEANSILQSDLLVENEKMKEEIESLKINLGKTKDEAKKLSEENRDLKNSLHDQVYSQKVKLLDTSKKNYDIFFRDEMNSEINRLLSLEYELKNKIATQKNALDKYKIQASELRNELDELHIKTSTLILEAKNNTDAKSYNSFSKKRYDELKEERVTDEQIVAISNKNNLELFVGGNLLNKVGVFFLILGILTISRYSFIVLPDVFKGILMFAISGSLLGLGEFLSRKNVSTFSIGITSAGVAGLFISLVISYFMLNLMVMTLAFILCLLITFTSFLLARRYNSQVIACFALIGGYMPITYLGFSSIALNVLVYFIILNILALTFALYKNWKVTMVLGYVLNLICIFYIIGQSGTITNIILVYTIFAFGVYTAIPIIGNYRLKKAFTKVDLYLIGANTLISSIIIYELFWQLKLSNYFGVLAIAFAIIYLMVAIFVDKKFTSEKITAQLLYITGLTFVVLTVPFQFGIEWISIGWQVQGSIVAICGILLNNKTFKKAGFIIVGLCLVNFVLFDVMKFFIYFNYESSFAFNYTFVTIGNLLILLALIYKNSLTEKFYNVYKYFVVVNLLFFIIYIIWHTISYFGMANLYKENLKIFLSLAVTFAFAVVLPSIKVIYDKGIKHIATGLTLISMVVFNLFLIKDNGWVFIKTIKFSGTLISNIAIIGMSILAIMAFRKILISYVVEKNLTIEWVPFSVSAYTLIVFTQALYFQYSISSFGLIINIIYIVVAFAWIIFGFAKKFSFMRKFGLVLAIFAIAKLFLVDLRNLTIGNEIVSYFTFGIALLLISFVYQYFNKKLNQKEE